MTEKLRESFTALGESCGQAAKALGNLFRAVIDCVVNISQEMYAALRLQAALNAAPPRVHHLAEHGKKYRTRKKNINRARKDYERRIRCGRT